MTSHAAMVCRGARGRSARRSRSTPPRRAASYDNPDKQIRIQITGGSTSTSASWTPLREAGAVAREMLRAAPRQRGACRSPSASRATARCTTRASAARPTASSCGTRRAQDVPERSRLKDPKDFRWIGKSLDRLDAPREGRRHAASTASTCGCPAWCTAVIVRPPVRGAHGREAATTRAARARRGVRDVVSDRRGRRRGRRRLLGGAHRRRARSQVTWNEGHGATLDTDELFALVRRAGREARHDGPRATATSRDGLRGKTDRGDLPTCPYLAHATMEPQNATAWITNGRCEVWAPTQSPGIAQWRVAEAIGFDLEDVAIHTTMLGGGFGRRGLVDYAVEAARLAQRTKKPVKVIWSREDDQANDFYRPMARVAAARRGQERRDRRLAQPPRRPVDPRERGRATSSARSCRTRRRARCAAASRETSPRSFARGTIADRDVDRGRGEPAVRDPEPARRVHAGSRPAIPVGFWRSVGHSYNAFVDRVLPRRARARRRQGSGRAAPRAAREASAPPRRASSSRREARGLGHAARRPASAAASRSTSRSTRTARGGRGVGRRRTASTSTASSSRSTAGAWSTPALVAAQVESAVDLRAVGRAQAADHVAQGPRAGDQLPHATARCACSSVR